MGFDSGAVEDSGSEADSVVGVDLEVEVEVEDWELVGAVEAVFHVLVLC